MARRKYPILAVTLLMFAFLPACDGLNEEASRTVPLYTGTAVTFSPSQADTLRNQLNISQEFTILTELGTLSLMHPDFQALPTNAGSVLAGGEDEGTYTRQFFDFQGLSEYPEPPSADAALQIVEGALDAADASPASIFGDAHELVQSSTSASSFEMVDANTQATAYDFELDRSVDFTFEVAADRGTVPLQGPGAKVKISLARNNDQQVVRGTFIQYSLWDLEPNGTVDVISQTTAEQQCSELYEGTVEDPTREVAPSQAEIVASARLVYFAPTIESATTTVFPYYECSGTMALASESESVLLRRVLVQATEQAPDLNASSVAHDGTRTATSELAPSSLGQVDVGVEYIADSQGLPGSVANANGFISTMQGASVPVEFVWSDFNAWEQDFKDPSLGGTDSSWVDNVDAVFYTGHADANGFTFPGNRDDGFLRFDEAGWGDRDLEWLVIAACGPLQRSNGTLLWYERWGDSFDGLHLLMAYAEVSYVRADEGRVYAEGLVNGERVRNAWVDAAMLQPSGVTYAYMGVAGSDGDTNFNDYFWGRGLGGGPDITNISYYWKVSGES